MFKNSRIMITGGCGFIGSHIAGCLKDDNEIVIVDDMSTGKVENIQGFSDDVTLVRGSILDPDAWKDELEGVDCVFHAAAIASVFMSIREPELTHEVNVKGTQTLLEAAVDVGVKMFVFISSAAVYGTDPALPKSEEMRVEATSPYGESKIMGEWLCSEYSEKSGLKTVSLRLFNVFGTRQNLGTDYATVIPKFINLMANDNVPQIYGDGKQTRDFVFVEDVVDGLTLAATRGAGKGEVYNIASGAETSINELVEILNDAIGKKIVPEHVAPVEGDIRFSYADISKARNRLGFEPKTVLKHGVKEIVEFYS
jgi:UDP-glucose 4-epimerase